MNISNISPVSIALMKAQMLSSLTSSTASSKPDESWNKLVVPSNSDPLSPTVTDQSAPDFLSMLTQSSSVFQGTDITGLSTDGYNMTLADPVSAYKMMTAINKSDVSYKTQFSELTQMQSSIAQMQDAGRSLGSIALSASDGSIKTQLQQFVEQYNGWMQRFNPDIQKGGALANTQAAQVSLYELEQNMTNRFLGAKDGIHGLRDMGVTIDPNTRLATLDTVKLDALLATDKPGVVNTVQEFGANFAKAAGMLNSDGNFILKQLDNLSRAIHYIADNKDALQKEFGTGDIAKPAVQVAQALAEYHVIEHV